MVAIQVFNHAGQKKLYSSTLHGCVQIIILSIQMVVALLHSGNTTSPA